MRAAATMSSIEGDKFFAGRIPELYETYLVPLIFEPYGADLAERVAARPPSFSVLEAVSKRTNSRTRSPGHCRPSSRLPLRKYYSRTSSPDAAPDALPDLDPLAQARRRYSTPRAPPSSTARGSIRGLFKLDSSAPSPTAAQSIRPGRIHSCTDPQGR